MSEPLMQTQASQGEHPLLMLVQRLTLFALLWWLLTEGERDAWGFGVPLILLTTAVSYALAPPTPRSLRGLMLFLPFFIGNSLKGGIDVAWRTLHPALPISPILVDYRMHLPDEQARLFMVNSASLLPGTLSIWIEGPHLLIHVLDGNGKYYEELKALERRVAALFLIAPTADEDDDI